MPKHLRKKMLVLGRELGMKAGGCLDFNLAVIWIFWNGNKAKGVTNHWRMQTSDTEMAAQTEREEEYLLEDIRVPNDEERINKILELLDPSGQPQFWKDVRKLFGP